MSSKMVSATIKYANPGARPPIFLAGSFSEPAWDPVEMDYTTAKDGEHQFTKEVTVKEDCQFQYKFRIGAGDWWALDEDSPTVTDDLGNRNNLLAVPSATEYAKQSAPVESGNGESAARSAAETTLKADRPHPQQQLAVPELAVEEGNSKPRHEINFGSQLTAELKDVHGIGIKDTESDHAVTVSGTSAPLYAANAAEVADTAATLDREAPPNPLPDKEAGEIGMRRLSSTPIPEVALTAAEVADTAFLLDQDETSDERMISLPRLDLDAETPSGLTTPWDERVPLFSHEYPHPPESENHESPPTVQQHEKYSPSSQTTEEAVIDYNDPTLEKFPTDRMAVLRQIRSIESRLGVDEVRDDGSRSPVVVSPRNTSSSQWSPSSTGLEPDTSLPLEVISEEAQVSDRIFAKLPSPIPDDGRIPPQLEVIPEDFQTSEILVSKLADSANNVEQPDTTNSVTISKEKPMLMPTPRNYTHEGLIETRGANQMIESIKSRDLAQLKDLADVHELTTVVEEPIDADKSPKLQKPMETELSTANKVEKETDGSIIEGPLPEHERLAKAEEPNNTGGLPEAGKLALIESPTGNKPSRSGNSPQHTMSTKSEDLKNVEISEMQPENFKIPGTDPGLMSSITLDDKTNVEASSIGQTERVSNVDSHDSKILGQPKVVKAETDGSIDEPQTNDLKEIVQSQNHTVIEQLKQNQHPGRNFDLDKINDSQERVEISKSKSSDMVSSEINGIQEIDRLLVREGPGNCTEEPSATAPPNDEVQQVEPNTASREHTSYITSLVPRADSPAISDTTSRDSVRRSPPAEKPVFISAAVDETKPLPVSVVGDSILFIQKQDPADTAQENEAEVVTESNPESALDKKPSAAANDEELSMNVAEEIAPTIATEDNLPETAAGLGMSRLAVGKDLSTGILDEDNQNIGNGEEILAATIGTDSPPFLVHAAQSDPFGPEEIAPAHSNGIDTAKSTSFEEPLINTNNDSSLKTRISSAIDRPITPASIHSALNRKEPNNFFKALWRTLFVGWIGGLLHRVFGGGRSS